MAGILHNVVIHPATPRRSTDGLFRVVSRSDGKTSNPSNGAQRPPRPSRSAPNRCPICGTYNSDCPRLFTKERDLFKCTICGSKIKENGSVVMTGISD